MKIAFNGLMVEITRKCQLQCAHCMRGDAQEIDIDKKTIETLLKQTSEIEYLQFTGGEPTLNISGMEFFLDTMIKNNIPLYRLQIITNGVLLSKQFTELLKHYYDWIEKNNSIYNNIIKLYVSSDKYHNGANIEKAIDFYNQQLKEYKKICVDTYRTADFRLLPSGRGKQLTIGDSLFTDINKIQSVKRKTKIEVLTKDNKTFCPLRKFETVRENEARILCEIYLTVNGDLISPFDAREYVEEDKEQNRISNVNSNILKDISVYNRFFPHCIEFDLIRDIYFDKEYQKLSFKMIASIFKNNQNNSRGVYGELFTNTLSVLNWNETLEKLSQYHNSKTNNDEVSFEPSEQDILSVYNELMELHRKGARHYFYQKNHREPTEQEIDKEITLLYQGFAQKMGTY